MSFGTAICVESLTHGLVVRSLECGRQEAVHVADDGDGAALAGRSDGRTRSLLVLLFRRQRRDEVHRPLNPLRQLVIVFDAFETHDDPSRHRPPARDREFAGVRLRQRFPALLRAEPDEERAFRTARSKLPVSRKPLPPNIFFSSMFFLRAGASRMRAARDSSKAVDCSVPASVRQRQPVIRPELFHRRWLPTTTSFANSACVGRRPS